MKKLILISLIAVLCILFCACGEKDEDSSESTDSTTAAATTAANKSETKGSTDTTAVETTTGVTPYDSAKEAAVAEAKKFLVYMGYAEEDAKYGVDNCGADWNEQAAKRAKALSEKGEYSYDNLVEKLESEGFTHEQAVYGASSVSQSSGEQSGGSDTSSAVEAAKKYLDSGSYSYTALVDKLQQDGYSTADAEYAANNCGADWNKKAAEEAKALISSGTYTKEELIDKLMLKGYTFEQAASGAEANGY